MKTACLLLVTTIGIITGCSNPSSTNPSSTNPATPSATPFPPAPPSAPPAPPAFVLSGNYTLTMTPSPSCALVPDRITGQQLPLPDAVRMQAFGAAVTQQESNMTFDFKMSWVGSSWDDRLPGSLNGNQLRFSADCIACTCEEAFGRPLGPHEEVGWCGTWTATVDDPKHISGVLSGGVVYIRNEVQPDGTDTGRVGVVLQCNASDHRFTLAANE